jgi:Sec-independent protein translocase protein TatA
MGLLKIVLWGIVLYYLYKFVFNVVVPVSKATSQMKSKMQQMQDEQIRQQQAHQQQTFTPPPQQPSSNTHQPKATANSEGDYIEFEEVK